MIIFLKAHKNNISNIGELNSKIKVLNLYLNKFDFIPSFVWDLSLLEVFSFGMTKIKSISDKIANLKNLNWLTLVTNDLAYLPDSLCDLQKLQGMNFTKNKLNVLPTNIGNLKIKELSLHSNELEFLPNSFWDLKLNKLNLSSNKLDIACKSKLIDRFGEICFLEI